MSDPDSVTTRGAFTNSAATSLTAIGAASASTVVAADAPERPQPTAPASTAGSASRANIRLHCAGFFASFIAFFIRVPHPSFFRRWRTAGVAGVVVYDDI